MRCEKSFVVAHFDRNATPVSGGCNGRGGQQKSFRHIDRSFALYLAAPVFYVIC